MSFWAANVHSFFLDFAFGTITALRFPRGSYAPLESLEKTINCDIASRNLLPGAGCLAVKNILSSKKWADWKALKVLLNSPVLVPALLSLLLPALLPRQLDVDVHTDLLQLNSLHPCLALHLFITWGFWLNLTDFSKLSKQRRYLSPSVEHVARGRKPPAAWAFPHPDTYPRPCPPPRCGKTVCLEPPSASKGTYSQSCRLSPNIEAMKRLSVTFKVWRNVLFIFLGGFFFVPYSTLLHLPPLRFHCAGGCWDWTQDHCNWCIGSQTL